MRKLLWSNFRAHLSRYIATAIAVALACAFFLSALVLSNGFYSCVTRAFAWGTSNATGVISEKDISPGETQVASPGYKEWHTVIGALKNNPNVKSYNPVYTLVMVREHAGTKRYIHVETIPQEGYAEYRLLSGKIPVNNAGILLTSGFAETAGLQVGDEITLSIPAPRLGEAGSADSNKQAEQGSQAGNHYVVSGIVDNSFSFLQNDAFILPKAVESQVEAQQLIPSKVAFVTKDNQIDSVKKSIVDLGYTKQMVVQPQAQYLKHKLSGFSDGSAVMTGIFLLFPILALLTAIIVVSVTFQILLTQRKRELALLRALGATQRQVRKLVLLEAVLVGGISAAIGVVLGAAAGLGLNQLFGLTVSWREILATITPTAVIITLLVGVVITLIASFGPVRRVAKVSPMVALHPEETVVVKRRLKRFKLGFGLLFTIAGFSAVTYGHFLPKVADTYAESVRRPLLLLFGGMASFVGLLVLTALALPRLSYMVGRLFGKRSLVVRLASENLLRNPSRVSATGTALLLGLTIMISMLVGGFSIRSTLVQAINNQFPVDVITSRDNSYSTDTIKSLQALEGVEKVVVTDKIKIKVTSGKTSVIGVSGLRWKPELQDGMRLKIPAIKANSIWTGDPMMLRKAGQSAIQVGSGTNMYDVNLVKGKGHIYVLSSDLFDKVLANYSYADDLGEPDNNTNGVKSPPAAKNNYLLIKAKDTLTDKQLANLVTNLQKELGQNLEGSLYQRVVFTQVINGIMWGAGGLLAVSILVALVGVANTLSLSVLERKRENALLRAMGMTKKALKWMLTAEALLLTLCAGVVGVIYGIFYAIVGIDILGLQGVEMVVVIPFFLLFGAFALIILASLLASWLPGRKATKVLPVQALADAH